MFLVRGKYYQCMGFFFAFVCVFGLTIETNVDTPMCRDLFTCIKFFENGIFVSLFWYTFSSSIFCCVNLLCHRDFWTFFSAFKFNIFFSIRNLGGNSPFKFRLLMKCFLYFYFWVLYSSIFAVYTIFMISHFLKSKICSFFSSNS